MSKHSAGIVVFRRQRDAIEVLLVHPAGPFWAKKDSWSIPKGELDEGEDYLTAAKREFIEETGIEPLSGEFVDLGAIKQSGGKTNFIWAIEGDPDLTNFHSNTFSMEWPPNSGQHQEFPEVDRAQWFDLEAAKRKLFKAQAGFIDRLIEKLDIALPADPEQQFLL